MSIIKKISLVDVEVKEPSDHPVWLQPASNEDRFPRSKILDDVHAMKERARKSRSTISVPGAFRMNGDQYHESVISESGESKAETVSPTVSSSTDRNFEETIESQEFSNHNIVDPPILNAETVHTPPNSHHQSGNPGSSQSTLSDSSNIDGLDHQLSPADLSLSLPELREIENRNKGKLEATNQQLSSSSSSLHFGTRGGRVVVQIGANNIVDDFPLDQPLHQNPIQGHIRHHSDGSSHSILSGTSCDVQALKERARRGRNALLQPGAYAIKNLEDSPVQVTGEHKNSKNVNDESSKSMVDLQPIDARVIKDRARRTRGLILQPGAYPSQNRDNDDKSPQKPSHVRHHSGGSLPSVSSLSSDIKSLKERVRRGRGSLTTPGAFSAQESEVGITYAPSRDMIHDRRYSNESSQSDMSPYKGAGKMSDNVLISSRNSFQSQYSVEVSPQLQIPKSGSDRSISSNKIDIQAIKNRVRYGRNHETHDEISINVVNRQRGSSLDVDEEMSRDSSRSGSHLNGKMNPCPARHDDRPPPSKTAPGSNWVDPFMEITEHPESSTPILPVGSTPRSEIPRVEFRSNIINAPVQHQSVWEMEQAGNRKTLSPFCKIEKNVCLMIVGIFLVIVGGVGIAIGLSKANVSRPCLEVNDKGDQSTRFRLISDILGESEPNSQRRMAMCWLADTDLRQISLEDQNEVKQRFFLALLYYSTVSKEARMLAMKSWMSEDSECQWSGVQCDDGKVSVLYLENANLEGSIPTEIGFLSHLSQLHLTENKFFGTLPDELFKLSSLVNLILDFNQFQGTVSSQIGNLSQLTALNINTNKFTGSLPSEIFSLINIGEIRV
jgi:hypothetical protein